nr:MAG TPA: hypothetical protein [Caudoviricetes sp.]
MLDLRFLKNGEIILGDTSKILYKWNGCVTI